MSALKLTFSHSTTTVPLKRAGLTGRRTRIRVLYGAVSPGTAAAFQRPLVPHVPTCA
jgi:hypothetical protein